MPKLVTESVSGRRADSTVYTFKVLKRQLDKLKAVSLRDGVPVAEQIRRGIDLWLRQQGA